MLTIHHLGISQSERIVWLCEELEIPYQLVRYDRDPNTRLAPADYKALHPFGTAPVITDGKLVLGETGAIMDYIIAKYGSGRLTVSADEPNFADYLFWLHFANGSFMPSALIDIVVQIMGGGEGTAPHIIRALRSRGERAWQMTEARLKEAPYLAGQEFTAADVISVFALTTLRAFVPRDLAAFPNITSYLKRIAARPGYQRAMKKAEPGMKPMID
jgi:glutathione S-transferase